MKFIRYHGKYGDISIHPMSQVCTVHRLTPNGPYELVVLAMDNTATDKYLYLEINKKSFDDFNHNCASGGDSFNLYHPKYETD